MSTFWSFKVKDLIIKEKRDKTQTKQTTSLWMYLVIDVVVFTVAAAVLAVVVVVLVVMVVDS